MDEFFKAIFSAPIATLLIVAGVGFLAIAVLGKISGTLEAGKTGRLVSGTIGTALLVIGLNIYFRTTPGPVSSPSATLSPAPTTASSAPSPKLSTNPAPSIDGCPQQSLKDVTSDRIVSVEVGAKDAQILDLDQPKEPPIAIVLTDNGKPVGAIKFQFYASDTPLFKVKSVIDAQCKSIEEYKNTTSGGDKHVLQNFDTLQVSWSKVFYAVRFEYNNGRIGIDTIRQL